MAKFTKRPGLVLDKNICAKQSVEDIVPKGCSVPSIHGYLLIALVLIVLSCVYTLQQLKIVAPLDT